MLSPEECPYTGPKGSDATKHDDTAPTIEALKRAMVRLGFLDKKLSELDGYWAQGSMFDQAFGEWSLKKGFQNDHTYGEGKWEELRRVTIPSGAHAGEYALDAYACDLIRDEKAAGGSSAIEAVRKKIVAFCEQGLRKPGLWNYTQNRAVDLTVDPWGGATINSDCSGSVLQAVYHAKKVTGHPVKDPAKQNWSGYGNTDLYEDDWPAVSGNYLVGDLGHYEGHVTLCIKKGGWDSSEWWSFGSEPCSRRKLSYRNDFRKVVRPDYL
jgi:hypothetical protein